MTREDGRPGDAAGLRRRAEEMDRGKAAQSPENLETLSPEETRRTLHELRVHQIELAMQNEELRRTQVELDAARTRYFDLYDLAPVGYCTVSEEGLIREANLTAAGLLGEGRGALVRQPVARFILKEDQDLYYRHRKQLFETGEPQACELRMVKKDGTAFWARLEATAAEDADGAPVGRVAMSDITERKRAEEALRESEETHRALVTGLPDIVMRFDRDRRHLFVSDNVREVFDLQAAQFIGKTHRELGFPEAQCRSWEEAIRGVFASGAPFETEFRFEGKQGPAIHNWRLVPERDGQGMVRSVLSLSRDITAHRRAEENYRTLFREMPDGCSLHEIVCDGQGKPADYRFLAVNPAFERMTGLKAQDILGKTVLEVMPGTERGLIETYGKVALTGEPVLFENYAAELQKHFEVTAFRPAPNQFACIFADITARKRAEAALRESEERYRSILNASPDDITIMDIAGRILMVSPVALTIWHCEREDELLGHLFTDFIVPEDRDRASSDVALMFQGVLRGPSEYRGLRPDGSTVDVEVNAKFIRDAEGQPTSIVFVVRDITARKALEAQLQQAQKMESIGRLAGGVAHDFNNMLTVINGYSQLLLAKLSAGDPLRANLAEIQKAGERAAGLTRQLLAFSRKQVLLPRRLDLNRVVEEMRPMLERLVGEAVEVSVALNAESETVLADPHQLEQVIMNLAVNGRDAMPDGGKLLIETALLERDESYARSHPEARAGRYVMLAVSDTGVGMVEETRQRIFEPFFTTKGAGQGTGLGLSMVQGIVAQSGGYVDVYSEQGQGTTFKIYLPALAEAAADAGRPAAVPALGGKETVLVVEDQAEVRNYAVAVLKSYGYRVIQAENAGEALLLCERERGRIHLVLTDVVMPNLSGRELANRLGKRWPGIKVLFMSGYTDDAIVHRGVLEKGAEFIQKPFSPEQLAIKLREMLVAPAPQLAHR